MDPPKIIQRPLDEEDTSWEAFRPSEDAGSIAQHHFVIPEERKLGYRSTALLIVNRMVGTGIFSTPSTIMQATDNVGSTMLFWVLGGFMTFWLFVYLELGTAIPRSGGEKVYLERIYRRPKYLATCLFAVEFVFLSISAANTVNFSAHILRAAGGAPERVTTNCNLDPDLRLAKTSKLDQEWLNKGISIGVITGVALIHALLPRLGIVVSNLLGGFKLVILLVIVCSGFAALSGKLKVGKPDNFSTFRGAGTACELPPHVESAAVANYAIALLQVLYSYAGWENANYVLSEVRNAPRTLKRSAPVAVLTVTVLYILANVAYFSALTKSEIANSNVTVAADFFRNVYGASGFIDTGVPVLIALSALGNVFAQTFAFSRVKQEFGKQGLFPFSRLWASDWPCQAPTGGIFLHWLFTCIVIVGPSVKDAYPFVSTLHVYTQSWVKLFIGIGLLYLTYSKHENWRPRRTELHAWPVTTVFWIISLAFVIVAPFLPNTTVSPSIPWFVVPTVGTSVFLLGGLYWLGWAKIWPMFGYAIHHDIQELPDGSEVVRFVHVNRKKTLF